MSRGASSRVSGPSSRVSGPSSLVPRPYLGPSGVLPSKKGARANSLLANNIYLRTYFINRQNILKASLKTTPFAIFQVEATVSIRKLLTGSPEGQLGYSWANSFDRLNEV